MKYLVILVASIIIVCSCSQIKEGKLEKRNAKNDQNFPAEGFNEYGSDRSAIEIADKVMKAMGGRKNWDDTRYFTWNFFGFRTLWWDKKKGNVRIQLHNEDSTIILVNIFDNTGKVMLNGAETNQQDSLAKYLKKGKDIWINDSYWLFMPFKLKDSGVTLRYIGEDTTQLGVTSDLLSLTFENIGNTPQNKYHVWVDRSDNLIKQWSYYQKSHMETPNFITPWEGYEKYHSIFLAGDRGQRKITNIDVPVSIPESVFTEF